MNGSRVSTIILIIISALTNNVSGAALSVPKWDCPPNDRKWSSAGLRRLERSYWLHASLGASLVKGYWAKDAAVSHIPLQCEINNAARILRTYYAASRLYLIYHNEIAIREFAAILSYWKEACEDNVDIIPTFVLVSYDKTHSQVFSSQELRQVCEAVKALGFKVAAVYDVLPNRNQGELLQILADEFPSGLIRLGIQPGEEVTTPFVGAVQDTWSAMCYGKSNTDWYCPGFGAETLHKWIKARNAQTASIAWDLVAVAWDYEATQRGEYPGYDDARKNMPLPAGRNRLAARLILSCAEKAVLRGFSSDLLIIEANSRGGKRDPAAQTLYECLKRGKPYTGYFAKPLDEIASIYRDLANGRLP
ncbi:MAG: hypothetical protein QHI38_02550 [Armatimonadota bacterium]|nr:hypothetical protein [Armatimonadota bacterium]